LTRGALTATAPAAGQHLTLPVVTVEHHEPVAVVVDLMSKGVDVGGHLGLQGRSQHLPGTVADDLV
jgi:hypothetical protein